MSHPLTKIKDIVKVIARSERAILIIDAGNLPNRKPSRVFDLTKPALTKIR
jgi:tRNA A37 threonylcarbamoyladenosine synthetase subunit TsaC/SUA5/YrdC